MKRELIIEKTHGAGDWVHLDLGDEVPAMTFQINDLNDMKDRQTSYSQALGLPITPNNCRAFGFANEFAARSAAPYSIHRCAWYEDGIQVIGTNFRLELLSVSKVFNCQIVSNLLGLFETLQTLPVEALNLEPVLWDFKRIIADLSANDENSLYAWAFPITTQYEPGVYRTLRNGFMAAEVMLYFRFIPLVREILGQAGYALDTDVETVPGYIPDCISLADFRPGEGSMAPLEGSASGGAFTASNGSAYPVYLLSQVNSSTFKYCEVRILDWVRDLDVPTQLTTGYEYCSPGYMKCRVSLNTVSSDSSDIMGRVRYRIQRIGVTTPRARYIIEQEEIDSMDSRVSTSRLQNRYQSDIIEMSPGDRIYIEIILLAGKEGATYTGTFDLKVPATENAVPAGGYLYPDRSTDFKNQMEIIKLFLQLYGLFVDVDTDAKVLRAYSLNRIVGRAKSGDFADWSSKIDMTRVHETSFRLGSYEQENRVLFGSNSLLGVQTFGVIGVDNANLRATKDLFTLSAESTKNGTISIRTGAADTSQPADIDVRYTSNDGNRFKFRSWSATDYAGAEILIVKYRASKTHIIHRQQAKDPGYTPGSVDIMMLPRGVNVGAFYDSLPWSDCYAAVGTSPEYYVSTYYRVLGSNVLKPARVIEAMFNLTPSDIENLDLLRPVYIGSYGAFFYIQKINNYQARKLTKVTLVCLNATNT